MGFLISAVFALTAGKAVQEGVPSNATEHLPKGGCFIGDADPPNDLLVERRTPFTRPTGRAFEVGIVTDFARVVDEAIDAAAAMERFRKAEEQCRMMGEPLESHTESNTFLPSGRKKKPA